jgi:hypothetical protein
LDDRGLRDFLAARRLTLEDSSSDQSYLLFADKSHLIVAAKSGQGLFYGMQTLRQLLHRRYKNLACTAVSIRDWPSMPWRGFHDDVSRGPIPTLAYMKKQIRILASYKVNLFSLYMEHVFEYKSAPLIAPKEAALTAAELSALVKYARRFFITVLPEQQTFGHLHQILKYEEYSDVAERPHGHVLTPTNERSYDIIRSLYSELLPLFPGPFVHVGGDETFELGRGKTKKLADDVGLGLVYLEHLKKMHGILQPYHKRLMFWGDIALKYPELLTTLPKDVIAVPWNYEARPGFENLIKPYREAGLDVMVAVGANNWNQIWPNLDVAYVNIRNFARDGQRFGALGLLNATWNDDGESLYDMSWPALIFGAVAAWQEGESGINRFKDAYDWAFYRNNDTTFRDVLENLDRAHHALARVGFEGDTDELFWADPFSESGARFVHRVLAAAQDIRLGAEHAIEALYRDGGKAHANQDTIKDMILAAWRWDALGMKIQFIDEVNQSVLQANDALRLFPGGFEQCVPTVVIAHAQPRTGG